MKITKLIYIFFVLPLLLVSCSESEADSLDYTFSFVFNSDQGKITQEKKDLKIGIVVDPVDRNNNANYKTKIYSSSPANSTLLYDNKEVLSTDNIDYNYNANNTLYFKFSAIDDGFYTITVEITNGHHSVKDDIEIQVTTDCTINLVCDKEKGSVSGSGTYKKGATVTAKATPKPGYIFNGWYLEDELISDKIDYVFHVKDNLILEAKFDKETYTILASATNGGVANGGGKYLFNSDVTVSTEHAKKYFGFKGWHINNIKVSDELIYKFKATSNTNIVAKWENIGIDVLVVKWNSTLVVINNPDNNGGLKFISYQWYKNGYPLQGATGQYISTESGLIYGSEYFCEMVSDEGKTYYSLPKTLYKQ